MRHEIFLDHRRDVDLIRHLQRVQRATGKPVVMKHKTLAKRLECSESTVRRSIDRLVEQGHIRRTYLTRPRGGVLCVYYVRTDVTYRRSSTFRRAKAKIEQVTSACKRRGDGLFMDAKRRGVTRVNINDDNKRSSRPSIDEKDRRLLEGLMQTAKAVGIDDRQRGFLKGAAMRYGVTEAWRALQIAYEGNYRIADLVRVTWGILKRQYPQGVMT